MKRWRKKINRAKIGRSLLKGKKNWHQITLNFSLSICYESLPRFPLCRLFWEIVLPVFMLGLFPFVWSSPCCSRLPFIPIFSTHDAFMNIKHVTGYQIWRTISQFIIILGIVCSETKNHHSNKLLYTYVRLHKQQIIAFT